MGYTAIPGGDIWLQIGTTQTPTSGSTVSFTSIPPVKKLRLIADRIALTAAGVLDITLNNDSGQTYSQTYQGYNGTQMFSQALQTTFIDTARGSAASGLLIDYVIEYANQACPKSITGMSGSTTAGSNYYPIQINYNSTAAINRVDFTTGSTFNATNTGTIAIYGAF